MNLQELKNKLKKGKSLKAFLSIENKNYTRKLRLQKSKYDKDGFRIVVTLPKYKNYTVEGASIIYLIK
jgi:hypothetical protein